LTQAACITKSGSAGRPFLFADEVRLVATERDDELTDAAPDSYVVRAKPAEARAVGDDQPLAGVLVGAEWPPRIETVVVPRHGDQRTALRQFFGADGVDLIRCGFGIWLCTGLDGVDTAPNLVAVPTARIMRSAFEGELFGPAVFLASRTEGSTQLTALNDAQHSLVHRAYAIAVTQLMDRAEGDEEFRRRL
jgi:hypothetical protein